MANQSLCPVACHSKCCNTTLMNKEASGVCACVRASTSDLRGEGVRSFNTFPRQNTLLSILLHHSLFHPTFSSNPLLLLFCSPLSPTQFLHPSLSNLAPSCVFTLAFLFLPLLTSLWLPSSPLLIAPWLIHSLLSINLLHLDWPLASSCLLLLSSYIYCLGSLNKILHFILPVSLHFYYFTSILQFILTLYSSLIVLFLSAAYILLCYISIHAHYSLLCHPIKEIVHWKLILHPFAIQHVVDSGPDDIF